MNLPTLEVGTELILCATGLKFKYVGFTAFAKGGFTTRFDPPPNGLRELKLHRSSANGCTKRKIFLKIFLTSDSGVKGHKVSGVKINFPSAPVWSV